MVSPELLRRHSFFGGFTLAEVKELALCGQERSVPEGEMLFADGDRADFFYFLADGEMETLIRAEEQGDIALSTLPAGEPLGWSALMEPHVFTASARAVRPSRVIAFGRPELAKLMEDTHFAAIMLDKLATLLSHRLRDAQVQLLSLKAQPVA